MVRKACSSLTKVVAALSTTSSLLSSATPASAAVVDVYANNSSVVDDAACDCWSAASTTFSNHKRWDFSSMSSYVAVPEVPSEANAAASAYAASEYFLSDEWTSFWSTQTWAREETDTTIFMANSAANVYIAADDASPSDTFLVLRTARHSNGLQSAGELQSLSSNLQHMSVRMYARTVGAAGACTAMFTYLDKGKNGQVQEADIEFLTKDERSTVHYTNQPVPEETDAMYGSATLTYTMPQAMGEWAEHRIDWTEGLTEWYINGQRTWQSAYNAPIDPTRLMFNSWSNGNSWTGVMEAGQQARLEIKWIEVAYNVEGEQYAAGSCTKTCDLK